MTTISIHLNYHKIIFSNLYGSLFEWVNTGNSVVDKTGNETRKVYAYSRLWSIYLDGKKAEKVW